MPKIKTHSGTKDRVRVTRNGKVLRRHSMGNHFLRKKSEARKRKLAGVEQITGKQSRTIKKNLGM
jgi:large subunit ribosomal protein L35